MEDLNSSTRMHKVTMTNRRNCIIGGVSDVLSFDIHEILLETEQGMLMIKGDDLHVSRLTLEKERWISTGESTALLIPMPGVQGIRMSLCSPSCSDRGRLCHLKTSFCYMPC